MGADDEQIPPEVREAFTKVVLRVERRRKINLLGTLIALLLMLLGLPLALVYMGRAPDGEFRGWALLLPTTLAGVALWIFGKWARKL